MPTHVLKWGHALGGRMTLADLARHLDVTSRVIAITAEYLTDLDKEIER